MVAGFIGMLQLQERRGYPRQFIVMEDFGFCSSQGYMFRVCRGDVIDGGSHPWWMRRWLGHPYASRFRLSFAVHDGEYVHAQTTGHTKDSVDQALRESMILEATMQSEPEDARRIAKLVYYGLKYARAAHEAWASVDETAIDELAIKEPVE